MIVWRHYIIVLGTDAYINTTYIVAWIDKETLVSRINAMPVHERQWSFPGSSRYFWRCSLRNAKKPVELITLLKNRITTQTVSCPVTSNLEPVIPIHTSHNTPSNSNSSSAFGWGIMAFFGFFFGMLGGVGSGSWGGALVGAVIGIVISLYFIKRKKS